MASSLNQLIKQIAKDEREASNPCNVIIGSVVGGSPLRINISDKITIDEDFLYVSKTVKDMDLLAGDKLILVRVQGGQRYAVIDKVV